MVTLLPWRSLDRKWNIIKSIIHFRKKKSHSLAFSGDFPSGFPAILRALNVSGGNQTRHHLVRCLTFSPVRHPGERLKKLRTFSRFFGILYFLRSVMIFMSVIYFNKELMGILIQQMDASRSPGTAKSHLMLLLSGYNKEACSLLQNIRTLKISIENQDYDKIYYSRHGNRDIPGFKNGNTHKRII